MKNACKVTVINTSKEKKNTTCKHDLKNSQGKIIMENNFKFTTYSQEKI